MNCLPPAESSLPVTTRAGGIGRRAFLATALGAVLCPQLSEAGVNHLPLSRAFIGQEKYKSVLATVLSGNWKALPTGRRMMKIAGLLAGTPYKGFTLEIDDKIECPSVNFAGLDCWTFFETVLCFARMVERNRAEYSPEDLLREIQWTRYRAGQCTGNYLERIHYLNEWFIDNEARGDVTDITRSLGGAKQLVGRRSREMTVLWKSYRYLRCNPSLREPMAKIEAKVDRLPVYYIPKDKVSAIESKLEDGDIAGIVTKEQGGVCSHVGLITRDTAGRARFMHASKKHRKVLVDSTISGYLNEFSSHAGLIVARPLPVSRAITQRTAYEANLKRLSGLS